MSKKVDDVMTDDNSDEISQDSRFGATSDRPERGGRVLLPGQLGPFGRLADFLRDVRAEMKRVSWPTAKDVKNTTIITLIAVVFFATYLYAVDRLWTFLLTQLNYLLNLITGAA